jgi:hypothetical protein
MTYAKPEINSLGTATQVIQMFQKQILQSTDSSFPFDGNPAYDLDE